MRDSSLVKIIEGDQYLKGKSFDAGFGESTGGSRKEEEGRRGENQDIILIKSDIYILL